MRLLCKGFIRTCLVVQDNYNNNNNNNNNNNYYCTLGHIQRPQESKYMYQKSLMSKEQGARCKVFCFVFVCFFFYASGATERLHTSGASIKIEVMLVSRFE